MSFIFLAILFLPIAEIAGFVIIGGKIGLAWTFLWLGCSTFLGIFLLQSGGMHTWERARQARSREELFSMETFFDDICLMIAAFLLIFPGFISDFLALPLLFSPTRGLIFQWLRRKYPPVRRTEAAPEGRTIIDGEFVRTDSAAENAPKNPDKILSTDKEGDK